MNDMDRRLVMIGGLAMVGGCSTPSAAREASDVTSTGRSNDLLTVSAHIGDSAPLQFAIDSAANASVIADDLAQRLMLPPGGPIFMNTLIARETVQTVIAPRFRSGALDVSPVRLALGVRDALGADGLIGTDLLADLRLDLRFRRIQRMRITHSRARGAGGFFDLRRSRVRITSASEQRFGQICTITAHVGQTPVVAILDTGAEISIGNTALARASRAIPQLFSNGERIAQIQSPTGLKADASLQLVSGFRVAGTSLKQFPLLINDLHTFNLWGLSETPAMLLGVDMLGLFESVAIDLRRGEVTFQT